MKQQDARLPSIDHFLQHESDIRRFIHSQLSCQKTSEDLTQETWLRFSRMGNIEHIADIKSFLLRIASNLAIDHLRRHQVEQRHQGTMLPSEDYAPSAERVVSARQQCSQLYAAIAELPPQCRVAFTLHRLKGKSYSEIATILSVSEKAVEKHISKALQHCRQRVRQQ